MKQYTEEDEARIMAVLKEIQSRVPKVLIQAAVSETKLTPTIEMVMNKALESDSISEEKKESIRAVMSDFTRVKVQENSRVTKQIDEFVSREIKKAQKAGLLPPKSHIKHLPSIKKLNDQETSN